MDTNPLLLALSALAGAVLGVLYFGGLWLTIQAMTRSQNPGFLLMVSFLLRSVLVIGGFYLISDGRLERLAAGMLAFFITRFFFTKYFSPERNTNKHGNQP